MTDRQKTDKRTVTDKQETDKKLVTDRQETSNVKTAEGQGNPGMLMNARAVIY